MRRVGFAVLLAAGLVVGGTIGFHHLLHERWNDAFYRTAVTVTLTGLDSSPRGAGAEYLTIVLAVGGVAIFGYVAAQAFQSIAEEIASDVRKDKRRRRMIDTIEDHFIICGYGRVGRRAAEEFSASGQAFVVLDTGDDAIELAREHGVLYRKGSGSDDESLERVGIGRARGLLASADSDAENLYITLSARAQRSDLMIVARASSREAERKLVLAGANRVVQPYAAAGTEMAKLALKPQVAAFLELVSSHAGPDLRFEELVVSGDCLQAGKTIRGLRIRSTTGAVVIALGKTDGTFDVTPNPDVTIDAGDVLIAIGTEPELKALEDLFAPGPVGR
ncbi:MAG TPA: NAD-binding protein [Gaiellaceae bacterium]|nr:NAD-binding protein [Gaiellaceae bacterium]